MTERILSEITASITELKINPMHVINSAGGNSVAILSRNKPVFYCVPPEKYEDMVNILGSRYAKIINDSKNSKV